MFVATLGLSGVCDQIGTSHSASRTCGSHRLARNFVGWNRRAASTLRPFSVDGEVEEVFTSTTLRTHDTVFLLFGSAGTKLAIEAKLQEFGENVEEAEGNLILGEEMQDDERSRTTRSRGVAKTSRRGQCRRSRSTSHDDGRRGLRQRGAAAPNDIEKGQRVQWTGARTANETSASRSRSCAVASPSRHDG